jgi:serine/threonine protein kinase
MIGKTLSHFKITAKLGEGGMGEVYRAEDTKLGREVAIKVLPAALTEDPERLARFEREAKVLASLSHPNIAGIYQIEEADGQQLLVMELVEGEDLTDRLRRGPVPVDEAVGITSQVAEGLEAAHSRGIVHRDLKPANIKIAAGGQVKILDFGLAKAHEASEETSPDTTRSPTLTAQMTQAGVILGTASYMAPEQARGQEADPRSDIWALGVVLYEMLIGNRLFSEPTVSDTLAAVLRADIDLEALPTGTPPRLRRVLRRCLEREPKHRYHAAADLRIDLIEALSGEEEAAVAEAKSGRSSRLPWMIAAGTAAIALVSTVLALWPSETHTEAAALRMVTSIVPSDEIDFAPEADALALSTDGTQLAFVGIDTNGQDAIWIRRLARQEVHRIPQTEGAHSPFWSPDGRALAFYQEGEIKILDIETGLIETLVPVVRNPGAAWSSAGDIVLAGDDQGIATLKRTGGSPRPVTETPARGSEYFRPDFLPDGEHFLFHERRYSSDEQIGQIRIGSLDGTPSRALFEAYSTAQYVEPGFILWWHQGNLRAQRFDVERLEMVGDPFSVVSDVLWDPRGAVAGYTASDNGVLIYRSGGRVAGNQLTWIQRDGEVAGTVGTAGSVYSPSLSPDGKLVAIDISGDSNQGDIWIVDTESGRSDPIVTWPEDDSYPVWSPDGTELAVFSMHGGGNSRIFQVDLTTGGEPNLLLADEGSGLLPRFWSSDGRTLLFLAGQSSRRDIMALDIESGDVRVIIADEFDTQNPSLSPDGRWIAFDSDMTGGKEVYLAPFPDASRRVRVSTDGGFAPLWSRDGSAIFFATANQDAIFSVDVTFDAGEPRLSRPTKLFSVDMKLHSNRQYDTFDGQKFLVNVNLRDGVREPLTVLQNWADGS